MDKNDGGLWGAARGALPGAAAALAPGWLAAKAVTSPRLTGILAAPGAPGATSLSSTILKAYPELEGLLGDANGWTTMGY